MFFFYCLLLDELRQVAQFNTLSALIEAIENNNISSVRLLIENGADIDIRKENGDDAFSIACKIGNESIIKLLIDAKPDINRIIDEYGNYLLRNGNNNLMNACIKENELVVKILIDNGANLNDQNLEGSTALMIASELNNISLVNMLIENNCDANIQNRKGKTAFDLTQHKKIKTVIQNYSNTKYILK